MSAPGKQSDWLEDVLAAIPRARVTIFGDFCLDAYWLIDPDESELSVETGLPVRRVRRQRYSLGGAGNIAANLAALGAGQVRAVGRVGDDLFGGKMLALLGERGIDCEGMLRGTDWQTGVFAKPCVGDVEGSRIDFGGFNVPGEAAADALAERLDRAASASDAVILNQQVPAGVSTPEIIERINTVVAAHPQCLFIADSRHRPERYAGCVLKFNAHEAARMLGDLRPLDKPIDAVEASDVARRVFERTGKPVFVTRGAHGLIVADEAGLHDVPGIAVAPPIDPVGAGDTVTAGIAAVLGSGGEAVAAAMLANIAASVVVRKLQTTGTARPEEIRRAGAAPDYVYLPELADHPDRARFADGTEVEVVRELPERLGIRHAIFDHDGTLSTLREGWEHIMGPMMVRAILGKRHDHADEATRREVVDTVRTFIDRTTGVQTLVQMQGLVAFVREFGCVAEENILDMHGYKALYDEPLLARVRRRTEKLRKGERDAEDFRIEGAVRMLQALRKRGVTLYLVSGTDQADVAAEADALGYADLFDGGIFGAVGDVTIEAKRVVLERIFHENALAGPELATFGDGPVEIRETRSRGGLAVGVASNEARQGELNGAKRARLVRAGADLIVADFRQVPALLRLLGLG